MAARRGVLYKESTRSTEFESGSWLIRCGATSHQDELRRHLPGDLLLRQLRRLKVQQLLICDPTAQVDQEALGKVTSEVTFNTSHQPLFGQVDAVWDADVLHGLALEDRLELISWMDGSLRVGGYWICVARDHYGVDPGWGHPLSPEEVVGYFCPAYQVVHQEQLSVGVGPHRMSFATLVFTKRTDIGATQLDFELQQSIERVAAQRRAHHPIT